MTEPLKPPYLQKITTRGDFDVWIVDGTYVRGHIDEEFTNFGQHLRYPYIPEKEFWIDKEAKNDEHVFFVDHMLLEHELMTKGMDYDAALVKADDLERRERRKAGDVRKVTHGGKDLPDPAVVHEELWKKMENGVTVWIINGRLVRSAFDIDFTAGGHDHVYEFVPHDEVWIDDDLEERERGFVLFHELHERNLMVKGWSYYKAHDDSSRLEYHYRHHPDELHDGLAAEGWA